jgi:HYR domain/Secretion system C-terminal sorting domain
MTGKPYFSNFMRYGSLLLITLFSINLSFSATPSEETGCRDDRDAPKIECPETIYAYVVCDEKCVSVEFDEPTAVDNCDPNPKVWCEFQSGYCFPVGTTEIWCWARDKSGNEAKHFFNVVVKRKPDTKAPRIYCSDDIKEYIDCNETCAKIKFREPFAVDNCDDNPRVWCDYKGDYCFPIGTTKITCYAKDKSGNESSVSFDIIVKSKDVTPPHLTNCPKDMDLYIDCNGTCSRMMWWMGPDVSDDCDLNPKLWYEVKGKVIDRWYCFPLGSNKVTAYAQDKTGNKSSCSYNVVVKHNNDFEAPKMTCPSDVTVTITDCSSMCKKVTIDIPISTDNCDKNVTPVCAVYNGSKLDTINKDFCFMVGKTPVICTATDVSGNKTTCTFWVTVIGRECSGENPTKDPKHHGGGHGGGGHGGGDPCGAPCSLINGNISSNTSNALSNGKNLPTTQQLEAKDFTIYPNPTIESVNLNLSQYSGKDVVIQVVNSVGQQVYNTIFKEVAEQSYRLDVQNYPKGVYLIKVSAEGVQVATKKMLKL